MELLTTGFVVLVVILLGQGLDRHHVTANEPEKADLFPDHHTSNQNDKTEIAPAL